jgi:DNA-binding NarL/FixJ family response regulator
MKEILKYIQLYTGCNDHTLKRIEVMLEPRLNLEPKIIEKIVYVEKYVKRKPRSNKTLAEWSDQYYQENNTSFKYISQRRRLQEIVDNRNIYIKQAFFEGYTPTEIARYLNRNHSTILHTISK